MTQQHPITPPPQLVGDWIAEADELDLLTPSNFFHVANRATQWGAEQMWEACRGEIIDGVGRMYIVSVGSRVRLADDLGSILHPKPPSLKEQALEQLDEIRAVFRASHGGDLVCDHILRALESIPDPS